MWQSSGVLVPCSPADQNRGTWPGQFLKNSWTKTNALNIVCSTAWDTHHIKKWARLVHSRRSYSKKKVPYQTTLEERYTTSRAKIEHLYIIKRYIKYTYSESTLDGLFKTVFFSIQFKASRCQRCQPLVSNASRGKIEGKFTGQSL